MAAIGHGNAIGWDFLGYHGLTWESMHDNSKRIENTDLTMADSSNFQVVVPSLFQIAFAHDRARCADLHRRK
jgi:hypothetical protein